jgi:hypothetical protein
MLGRHLRRANRGQRSNHTHCKTVQVATHLAALVINPALILVFHVKIQIQRQEISFYTGKIHDIPAPIQDSPMFVYLCAGLCVRKGETERREREIGIRA